LREISQDLYHRFHNAQIVPIEIINTELRSLPISASLKAVIRFGVTPLLHIVMFVSPLALVLIILDTSSVSYLGGLVESLTHRAEICWILELGAFRLAKLFAFPVVLVRALEKLRPIRTIASRPTRSYSQQ
jgi:hypothetical protein